MPYEPTTWEGAPSTATPITAARLNKMEGGIASAHAGLTERSAGLQALGSKLMGRAGDMVIAVAGDSTTDESAEWFRLMCNDLVTSRPWVTGLYRSWNDTTQAYQDAAAPIQTAVPMYTRMRASWDPFNRVAADLLGSSPVRGGQWAGSAGRWSIDGASAVAQSSDTASGVTLPSTVVGDRVTLAANVTMDGTTASKALAFWLGASLSNRVGVYVFSPSGSAYLYKQVAGVGANVTSSAPVSIPLGADGTFDITLNLDGLTVTAVVNGTTITGALSAADAAAIGKTARADIIVAGAHAGTKINDLTVDVETVEPTQTLTVYNGAKAGSTLAYQLERLSAMYPVAPDVLFVSSSHNYGTTSPEAYLDAVEAFLAGFHNLHPGVPIVLCSQNPQTPPQSSAGRAAHRARLVALREYARTNGYGFVPVLEAFEAESNPLLIRNDGVHPTSASTFDNLTDPNNGQWIWKRAALDYLKGEGITTA